MLLAKPLSEIPHILNILHYTENAHKQVLAIANITRFIILHITNTPGVLKEK